MNRRLISVIIVAVGMIAGAVLVSNQQNISEEASEISDAGEMIIQPTIKNGEQDTVEKLNINLSSGVSGETPIAISAFSLRLKYPGDMRDKINNVDSEPFVRAEGLDEKWVISVNEADFADGVTEIDIAGVYSGVEGYRTEGTENFGYIEFIEGEFTSDDYATLGWDEDQVKMMTKQMPVRDIVKSIDKK